jgi:predicted MFS family arabinose efflux permease
VTTTTPGLWRHRDFLLLWGGQTISEMGSAVTVLALPLAAVTLLHARALEFGLLQMSATLPYLLVALPAGAIVDRLPRRATLVWCDVGRAAALASVPLAAASGALTMPQLYLVALVSGVLGVFFDVAYLSYLPSLVTREQLVDGNGKLQTTHAVSLISGSALGGGLVALLGAAGAVAVDAASYLVSVASVIGIRAREPVRRVDGPRTSLRTEITEGLRFAWSDPIMRVLMVSGCHSLVFSSMTSALFVLFLVRDLHAGAVTVGVVSAISGVGGLLGAATASRVIARVGSARVLWLTKLAFTGAFGLLPLARPPWGIALAAASGLIGAATVTIYNVGQVSYRQAACPPGMLGRLTATFRWVMWGAMPLGALLGGVLGGLIGVRATLAVSSIGAILGTGWLFASPLRTMRDLPAADPASAGSAAG